MQRMFFTAMLVVFAVTACAGTIGRGVHAGECAQQDLGKPKTDGATAKCVRGDACPPTKPVEMMRWYRQVLDARDVAAFRALIHPTKGIHRKYSASQGVAWQELKYYSDAEAADRWLMDEIACYTFIWSDLGALTCPVDFGPDSLAECQVATGVYGTFVWRKENGRIYLLSIDENAH